MKHKFSYLLLALFLSFYSHSFSQDKNTLGVNEFFTIHYYTFSGNATQDKIEAMETAFAKIDMVSEAKVKFKFEKNMGQAVVIVKEKAITSEGDKSFSPTSIKQVILANGFSPMEYTTDVYNRK